MSFWRQSPRIDSTGPIRTEIVRYGVCGLLNTAGSYLLYYLLLNWMSYWLAYTLAFVVGIATGYYLNARLVFRTPLRWQNALRYPLVYLVQYGAGLAIISLLVEVFTLGKGLAALVALVVTTPLSFLLTRAVVRRPV